MANIQEPATVLPTTAQVQSVVTPLTSDIVTTEQHVASVIAAFKAGGVSKAVTAAMPLVADVEQGYKDVIAAIPVVKAGFSTSECKIVLGTGLLIAGSAISGHPLPDAVIAGLASLAAAYTAARTIAKK